MTDVIEIEGLHKTYGNLPVLRGLNLRVGAGEVFGLLGSNGSGKSTLIHLMMGFLRPNSGRLRLFGAHPEQARARIGYVPERLRYHTRYSAREYLRFLGEFSGLRGIALRERVDRELEVVGLQEAAERILGTFSKGMLQRLGVAQALLTDPDLLLIDEPTSGLDPAGQREVLDLLAAVRDRGHTVFLCTHYLHEVEILCDRVGVLAGGRISAEAAVRDLRAVAEQVRIQVPTLTLEQRRQIESLGPGVRCDPQSIRLNSNTPALQMAVLRALLDHDVPVLALEPLENPLERLYKQAVQVPSSDTPIMPLITSMPVASAVVPPPDYQRGGGDTLLNELLGRNRSSEPEARSQEPE